MKSIFRKHRKLISAIISAISCAAILLTGTFAWLNTSQAKTNEFRGGGEDAPGGTLHDDFAEPNKDVYIENWGAADIFVRVRLDEYMELGDGAGERDANGDRAETNFADSLIEGASIGDKTTWYTHTPHTGVEICDQPFHDYWKWVMGGQKYYMPVNPADRANLGFVASDVTEYNGSEEGVRQTPNATVITMAEWIAMNSPTGDYWVLDTDGWAYWAAPLKPGTATGLLLDAVNLIREIDAYYFYAINVVAQMASAKKDTNDENWENFGDADNGGWTEDGHDLLEKIVEESRGADSGGNGSGEIPGNSGNSGGEGNENPGEGGDEGGENPDANMELPGIRDADEGSYITVDGEEWGIVKKLNQDGQDYALLLRRDHYADGVMYQFTGEGTYETSNTYDRINEQFNALPKNSEIKKNAVVPKFITDTELYENGESKPTSTLWESAPTSIGGFAPGYKDVTREVNLSLFVDDKAFATNTFYTTGAGNLPSQAYVKDVGNGNIIAAGRSVEIGSNIGEPVYPRMAVWVKY